MHLIKLHITKTLFLLVLFTFLGHETLPHHHHDLLKVHATLCNHADKPNQESHSNSCNILNYLSSPEKINISNVIQLLKHVVTYLIIEFHENHLISALDILIIQKNNPLGFIFTSSILETILPHRAPPIL